MVMSVDGTVLWSHDYLQVFQGEAVSGVIFLRFIFLLELNRKAGEGEVGNMPPLR